MAQDKLWLAFSRHRNPDFEKTVRTFTEGKGAYLVDQSGKKYFDAFSTLWTNLVGHGREEIIEAMATQSRKLSFMHLFSGTQHESGLKLAEKLLKMSPFQHGHCFFGLSGSDATECAIKMARQFWFCKGQPEKNIIVARKSTYHGTSYGALSVMGHDDYQKPFSPLVEGMHRVAPNDTEELKAYFESIDASKRVAAVLIEPVITSDGLVLPAEGYFTFLQELCKKYNVLIIADEVSTGMGRTGELYGSTLYGIKPDVVYLAKSLTSGYAPLSAIMATNEIFEAINSKGNYFLHGSTFAGHPVSCVAALWVLEIVEREGLVEKARAIGKRLAESFKQNLSDVDYLLSINGKATLYELTLKNIAPGMETDLGMYLYQALLDEGQYVRVLGKHLCIAPPLISTEGEIAILGAALRKVLLQAKTVKKFWEKI